MIPMAQSQKGSKIIHSWGAIALALGVSITTVKRWHSIRPMPLMQPGPNCRIMVYEDDLKAWFAAFMGVEDSENLKKSQTVSNGL